MAGKVLVVEDEAEIAELVRTYLEREKYEVRVTARGAEAMSLLDSFAPEVIVLDLMLPDTDGLKLCQEIRKQHTNPILMVSARSDDVDKIIGLEVGADDYLAKPFNPKELVARVRALFRRAQMAPAAGDTVTHGSLQLNQGSRRVTVGGAEVHLTPIEFNLLRHFLAQPGTVFTRQDLLDKVWGADFFGDERTVDVHIRNLRSKLRKADARFDAIQAVWGVGYRFD